MTDGRGRAARAVEVLRASGVELAPGLSDHEIAHAERSFGVRFGPDHRALLALALPVGERWPDWRDDDNSGVRSQVRWPVDGVLFDVENNVFWPTSWGDRPDDESSRRAVVEARVAAWPRVTPLYGHRYLPADFAPGAPVLSIYQTDVIYYGDDVLDWAEREFGSRRGSATPTRWTAQTLEPWSLFAFAEEDF
ncbi:hypothetical protein [Schumannella soli]|uniref:hypothetical protein n=1 Tax=Schumannella soli TaxID=2590779 RepID=UPI0015E85D14|nr:hypothetical protein [Schumannella soli]